MFVDFLGSFPDQEQAAGNKYQVASGKAMVEQREQRVGKLHDNRHRG